MGVDQIGNTALVLVIGLFLIILVMTVLATSHNFMRKLDGFEAQIQKLILSQMTPEQRERREGRLRDIEEQQRQVHGWHG